MARFGARQASCSPALGYAVVFMHEPIPVYASSEMVMPAFLSGTAPVATSDRIVLVLGDFRGDVWMMDL